MLFREKVINTRLRLTHINSPECKCTWNEGFFTIVI